METRRRSISTDQAAGRKPPHKTTECKRTVETPRDHRQKWIQRWIDDIGLCRFWDEKSQCFFVIIKKDLSRFSKKEMFSRKTFALLWELQGKMDKVLKVDFHKMLISKWIIPFSYWCVAVSIFTGDISTWRPTLGGSKSHTGNCAVASLNWGDAKKGSAKLIIFRIVRSILRGQSFWVALGRAYESSVRTGFFHVGLAVAYLLKIPSSFFHLAYVAPGFLQKKWILSN